MLVSFYKVSALPSEPFWTSASRPLVLTIVALVTEGPTEEDCSNAFESLPMVPF